MSPSTASFSASSVRPARRLLSGIVATLGAMALLASGSGLAARAATVPSGTGAGAPPTSAAPRTTGHDPDLGPHVLVFDPSMSTDQIQAAADGVTARQVDAEMGTGRDALLFKPGTYGTADHPLNIQVGYYTEVAGLGQSPSDVVINGHVDVYNRCLAADNCLALDNFWRSLSNLTINVAGGVGCRATANFWAVSQASPMRRVQVNGNLSLMDYCTAGPQFASGGFIADSRTGTITNGSQQQFLVRDSSIGTWSNGVWNQVFSGVQGAPAQSFPGGGTAGGPYTTLPTTPVSRERPYLYVDARGAWNVFVPATRTASSGPTWGATPTPGRSVPLAQFYLARPGDSVRTINAQLDRGRNVLLTPGVYDVDRSIEVRRPDALVLGLGIATLTAVGGAVPLRVDAEGADVAGLMIDAGPVSSPALMRIGDGRDGGHGGDGVFGVSGVSGVSGQGKNRTPTGVQDVFFRVGGPHAGRATVALQVDADHVVLDDIWAWRADHGTGVGWTANTSDHGVVVNGDDVTATGLFVEHFQKDNVVWNGERGMTVFFQNELPYDAPDQASWQHDGILGYAAYRVSPWVRTHELWGGGSYIFTNVDPSLHATHGFEVPVRPGVRMHDLLTVDLGAGTLDHVVNDVGAPVTSAAVGVPSFVTSYP
ncbi:adenylyl cyclase [Lapillicoccus sp.]|uniref:adenylyl cyclase n=1 Tax=Lapillicoccus sp. TaxID=1909287 RepID=UPI0025F3AA0D|nr:adenylyl cyclase [Lapillicoccus sp.]